LETRIDGFLQGILLLPLTLTLQRGLNQMYQEPQKLDQRWSNTRRRSNHRVRSQRRKAMENRTMDVRVKNTHRITE
jgi:hypothetical protein